MNLVRAKGAGRLDRLSRQSLREALRPLRGSGVFWGAVILNLGLLLPGMAWVDHVASITAGTAKGIFGGLAPFGLLLLYPLQLASAVSCRPSSAL